MSKHSALDTFGRSGNPAFRDHFEGTASNEDMRLSGVMTLEGAVNKTGILLIVAAAAAVIMFVAPGPMEEVQTNVCNLFLTFAYAAAV